MEKRFLNMFYTGGWDSTYMLIKILKIKQTIQPIYVYDDGRKSRDRELKHIELIFNELKEKKYFGGKLLPLIKINLKDIKVNEKSEKSYNNICKQVKLGCQYKWLSEISQKYSPVAIGIEKPNGEFSGCVDAIEKNGKLFFNNDIGYIDKEKSNNDLVNLFGNFCFPIINETEIDMLQNIKKWGLEDVMKNIWFCHNPIKNQPCGFCRPCEQKMECCMEFLLPEKSQKRYFRKRKIEKILGKKATNLYIRIYRKIIK